MTDRKYTDRDRKGNEIQVSLSFRHKDIEDKFGIYLGEIDIERIGGTEQVSPAVLLSIPGNILKLSDGDESIMYLYFCDTNALPETAKKNKKNSRTPQEYRNCLFKHLFHHSKACHEYLDYSFEISDSINGQLFLHIIYHKSRSGYINAIVDDIQKYVDCIIKQKESDTDTP